MGDRQLRYVERIIEIPIQASLLEGLQKHHVAVYQLVKTYLSELLSEEIQWEAFRYPDYDRTDEDFEIWRQKVAVLVEAGDDHAVS